ncbi:hypothetical protein ANSO36C_64000 (plasmid) [Nostoc cf. commune SO-36]|uniref:Uncharacterized protein n=1 Tax=Nostoc cf. commune SO-36 TaxID=449208 RepID=A0ABN6QGH3_NOSCO|nr:hypothetical protein [Nostoc commune]BDI20598.1 hypothetical protein ANSO36C_64000 [Nostoc cf. commune SO-36]
MITAILIFQRTNQPSIALTEEWTATQVADEDSITVRQTDGSQMSVELCGIDAPVLVQGKAPGQPLANEAMHLTKWERSLFCGSTLVL